MKGLYIHLPFCARKCPYCDFNSYQGQLSLADSYVDRLLSEAKDYKDERIDTIYIGGGTPSLLHEDTISRLLDGIFNEFNISEKAEVTIEVNPGTVNELKLKTYLKNGINRLSIGVQSFNDDMLRILGRLHSGAQAEYIIKTGFEVGFKNISADLMFSYKGQTRGVWEEDVKTAERLRIPHLSCYGLKVEEGTEFYKTGMKNLEEETEEKMQQFVVDYLKSCGLYRYEISNFAKPGFESKHNLIYWHCDDYIGLGAGAHSYIYGKRFNNILSPKGYIDSKNPAENVVTLSQEDKHTEKFIMGMRLAEGVNEKFARNKEMLQKYINLGYIIRKGENIAFTDKGFNISNYILSDII